MTAVTGAFATPPTRQNNRVCASTTLDGSRWPQRLTAAIAWPTSKGSVTSRAEGCGQTGLSARHRLSCQPTRLTHSGGYACCPARGDAAMLSDRMANVRWAALGRPASRSAACPHDLRHPGVIRQCWVADICPVAG